MGYPRYVVGSRGLAWRNYHKATQPEFWKGEPGDYRLRLMTAEIALPMNLPVEVSYHEARAFCNWLSEQSGKSIRMPDEAEYRRLMEVAGVAREHHVEPIEQIGTLKRASSAPIDRYAHGSFMMWLAMYGNGMRRLFMV